MKLLFENADWWIFDKPTGLSTQSAFAGDVSVESWIRDYIGAVPHVFSRLDQGTSGFLPIAKTVKAQNKAQSASAAGEITKTYELLSHVRTRNASWTAKSNVDGKMAETEFRLLGPAGEFFRYEARIQNGRKHQIRRHAKESQIPILGDTEYGGRRFVRLALHSRSWQGLDPALDTLVAKTPPSLGHHGTFADDLGILVALDRRVGLVHANTQAWRILHRGESKKFDVAIDVFGDQLCVWNFDESQTSEQAYTALESILKKYQTFAECTGGVIKTSHKDPHNKGLVTDVKKFGASREGEFFVKELGQNYAIDLTEAQHAGLFLDHRDNRQRLKNQAQGLRVANLFCYSGSFSVCALAGGASFVASVDSAGLAQKLTEQNLKLNFETLEPDRHKFFKQDARVWLEQTQRLVQSQKIPPFDFVICDPPTFSTTKEGRFSVEKEWSVLSTLVAGILSADGMALFSNNHREGRTTEYQATLQKVFKHLISLKLPIDFPSVGILEHARHFFVKKA